MVAVAGYALALLMGLTLGLLGAGGSILAMPIMVYFLNVQPIIATGYSLLVVGCTAMVGAISYWKSGTVHLKKALAFATPAMFSVTITRAYVVPQLPAYIYGIPRDSFIMLLFSALMLVAALLMMFPQTPSSDKQESNSSKLIKLIFGSLFVGFLTGMIGAGGGFLIIPSLIAIFNFTVKESIGTSLVVITINSFAGFNGGLMTGLTIDWWLLGIFISMTLAGVLVGTTLGKKIQPQKLKQLFAVFLIILSIIIFIREI